MRIGVVNKTKTGEWGSQILQNRGMRMSSKPEQGNGDVNQFKTGEWGLEMSSNPKQGIGDVK